MPPKKFARKSPRVTDFTPLVSKTSKLLRSDVEHQLRQDQQRLNRPLALESSNHTSIISARDALLATIDTFDQAQKDLDALKTYFDAAKEQATRQLSLHDALLSPIRRLPNEVLQLIFIQVHAASSEKERANPITTQVCSYWRQVAEATPFLWTSIVIDLTMPEDVETQVAKAEAGFLRARSLLVSVCLSQRPRKSRSSEESDSDDTDSDDTDSEETDSEETDSEESSDSDDDSSDSEHLVSTAALLIKHHDRLESLTIAHRGRKRNVTCHLVSRCHPSTDVIFKNLRTLCISPRAWDVGKSEIQALCDASPALEKIHTSLVPDSPGIRWENIKEFKGDDIGKNAFASLCSRAKRLQRADIYGSSWTAMIQSPSATPRTYAFDCLTSLSLRRVADDSLAKLATIPRPPVLRHLLISGYKNRYWETNTNYLSSFLKAWGSELEYLANEFAVNANELKAALQATPKLQGVRLRTDSAIPPTIFTLLPSLTHLELHATVHNLKGTQSEERVRKLLSRPLNPKSLKRLALRSVAFYPPFDDKAYGKEIPKGVKESWEQLSQELTSVGLRVHEYRSLDARRQREVEFGFDTEFFKDRGLE